MKTNPVALKFRSYFLSRLACLMGAFLVFVHVPNDALAAKVEVVDKDDSQSDDSEKAGAKTPASGREKARAMFRRKPAADDGDSGGGGASGDRYLGLHLGSFLSSEGFKWGDRSRNDGLGNLTAGVTYRMGEWIGSMDLMVRADFQTYSVDGQSPLKMSLLPMVMFPDVASGFPLYFGAGIGPGIFFKQLSGESAITLDYQLVAGARVLEVLQSTGFTIETGLKNHVHLLSDGQFNGFFVALGVNFVF